tara:strand:- start:173 stop:646 length:474 start_codon:yes stop_codon:yes gene_type:complete
MVKTEYNHRLPVSKGRQGPDLCNLDIREFVKVNKIRNKRYVSIDDLEVIRAEKDKGLSVAHFFGEWSFEEDGSINVVPDMEWITPNDITKLENIIKGRMGTPRQKYQPRKCNQCGKYWTNFCGVENHSKVVKREYLKNDIFGGLPMKKETCWKCDDV